LHAISYSKEKAKLKYEKEQRIQQELKDANKLFEDDPSSSNRLRLDEIKEKLELLYEEKVKGIVIRARARWHEYGERSTKYFLNIEKRNRVKKHFRKLLISGSITTDPYRILSEQKRFYQNLYKTKDSVEASNSIEAFLNSLNIPKLSEEQRQLCEGRISTEECRTIIETFQNNKSLRNDGLPIEFYKSCWDLISKPFIDCVNESFDKEEMSNSQRQAVITLLEKKDRTLIENWRPISLVNADAKIISKVIANRIKDVLPSIIHHNQTGYVKERYIGETVRSIFDIMDLTDKENMPGLLIFIDFEKTFDSLEWNFLYNRLDVFNFGPNFKRWIKTFYANI